MVECEKLIYIFDVAFQCITCGVAIGMIVAYDRTRGPGHWFYSALLENHQGPHLTTWQLLWMSFGRIFIGKCIYI